MTRDAQKGDLLDAMRRISGLEQRVTELEQRFAELRDETDPENWTAAQVRDTPKRRGRKPDAPSHITLIRDGLVNFLEDYWPELQPLCVPVVRYHELQSALQALARPVHGHNAERARHLSQHFDVLLDFLKSDRFREDPRQIANAMAGVPDVGWWRSLKLCEAQPCPMAIGERAIRDYIRRKHPRLFDELDSTTDLIKVSAALRRYRTKDATLALMKHDARYALRFWQEGKPDATHLR